MSDPENNLNSSPETRDALSPDGLRRLVSEFSGRFAMFLLVDGSIVSGLLDSDYAIPFSDSVPVRTMQNPETTQHRNIPGIHIADIIEP